MPNNKQTKQRANSPFELFEQFEQSDDVRLCTKGRMARGGTNRICGWTRPGSPLAKLSATEYIWTKRRLSRRGRSKKGGGGVMDFITEKLMRAKKVGGCVLQVNREEKF